MSAWSVIPLAVLPVAVLLAAWHDLTSYQIPNELNLALFLAFPLVAWLAGMPWEMIGWGVALSVVTLVLTFALFTLGWFGGGDAKMLAALACWMGLSQIGPFVILASLLGGVLAVALLLFRAAPPVPAPSWAPWIAGLQDKTKGVPYGIALAAAALVVYPETAVWKAFASG